MSHLTTYGASLAMAAVSGPMWLGLGGGESPTGLVNEPTSGGYARQAVTVQANGRLGTNAGDVVFTGFSQGLGTQTHAGLFTAQTGGQCVWVGALEAPISIQAGGTYSIAAQAMSFQIEAVP